ncbi:YeeE/YedE family protein [Roseicyclus sp.]|uniref:YeeE/YedE family protein n=1 Tax=Roseicyclus sp. TaxID=1914329 RepID=UPI003FA01FD3
MFETISLALGLEAGPRAASVWFGLALGLVFGALALLTRFCLRRALVGPVEERASARGVWALALAIAIVGTQAAVAAGWIGFSEHRFHATTLPVLGLVAGGLLFGAGAVLARGCITRLTVLTGGGNLRALTALFVFAVAAHATLQGVLAPVRTTLASVSVDLGAVSLAELPGGAWAWTAALAAAALVVAFRSGAGRWSLAGAALLGATVPAGWVGTGFLLHDEFDPIALESLSFTAPWADTLFWSVASTLREPGFGVGLVGGVLGGAFLAAILSRRFAWEGFESPAQMGRSLSGAALMGVGGVLAGGCTVGAGLSGIPTLSFAALLAFASIAAGMLAAGALDARTARGSRGLVAAE